MKMSEKLNSRNLRYSYRYSRYSSTSSTLNTQGIHVDIVDSSTSSTLNTQDIHVDIVDTVLPHLPLILKVFMWI